MVTTTLNREPYTAQLFTPSGQPRALKLCNGADWGAKLISSSFFFSHCKVICMLVRTLLL